MLKVTAVSALLLFATAANAAPLYAPAAGSDAQGFRQAHPDHYLLTTRDVDAYADNLGTVPAYMFLQHDASGKVEGSVWVAQGPQTRVTQVADSIRKEHGSEAVETHDIAACTSLGGRSFQVKEKQEKNADGSVMTYNSTPSLTSVTIATGTGISGELKLLSMQDFKPLLDSATQHQSAYTKGWQQLFAAEYEAKDALPASPAFCDTKQFVWPGNEKLPLTLGQAVTNAGAAVADGAATLKGDYKLFGTTFTSAEVKVSAQKLVSASYSAEGISSSTFDAVVSTLKSKYGAAYVVDHATRGAAVTDTVAYRENTSNQTVLVVQLLKRDKGDTTGELVISTRLP